MRQNFDHKTPKDKSQYGQNKWSVCFVPADQTLERGTPSRAALSEESKRFTTKCWSTFDQREANTLPKEFFNCLTFSFRMAMLQVSNKMCVHPTWLSNSRNGQIWLGTPWSGSRHIQKFCKVYKNFVYLAPYPKVNQYKYVPYGI